MARKSQITVMPYEDKTLGAILVDQLKNAKQFCAATAFLNSSGLKIIQPSLEDILERNGCVSIIHGADLQITDPEAISTLTNLKTNSMHCERNLTYAVYFDGQFGLGQRFHPKLYIISKPRQSYCAIVGSSNLTRGGLEENVEVNAIIVGKRSNEQVQQCINAFQAISDDSRLIKPDEKFVEDYRRLHEKVRRSSPSSRLPSDVRALCEKLMEDYLPKVIQREFAALAILNLQDGKDNKYISVDHITKEAKYLSQKAGRKYKWDGFQDRISSRLSENVYKDGRPLGQGLFVRRARVSGNLKYKLSKEGRVLARGLRWRFPS